MKKSESGAPGLGGAGAPNRKGQFFIASAIIMIIVVYFIYFNVLKTNEPDYAGIDMADFTYALSNIENEYGKIVELTLSNVSRTTGANPTNALNSNLTYFTDFVKNITAQRHIVTGITATNVGANSSYMNASINLTLKGVNSQVTSSFNAVREISIVKTQTVACTTQPGAGPPPVNKMDFRVLVTKEYEEPISGIAQASFGVDLGGADVTLTGFTDEGAGVYLFESSTVCAVGQNLKVNVTDQRSIFGTKTQVT